MWATGNTDVFFFPFMDSFWTNCNPAFHENLLKIKWKPQPITGRRYQFPHSETVLLTWGRHAGKFNSFPAEHQATESLSISRTHADFGFFIAYRWVLMLSCRNWYQNVGNPMGNNIHSQSNQYKLKRNDARHYDRSKMAKNPYIDLNICSFEQEIVRRSVWN